MAHCSMNCYFCFYQPIFFIAQFYTFWEIIHSEHNIIQWQLKWKKSRSSVQIINGVLRNYWQQYYMKFYLFLWSALDISHKWTKWYYQSKPEVIMWLWHHMNLLDENHCTSDFFSQKLYCSEHTACCFTTAPHWTQQCYQTYQLGKNHWQNCIVQTEHSTCRQPLSPTLSETTNTACAQSIRPLIII